MRPVTIPFVLCTGARGSAGYQGFRNTTQKSTLYGDVPIPEGGKDALERSCTLRLRNHHGHEIYERDASRDESSSDESGDADYEDGADSDGDVEDDVDEGGDLDEEGRWLEEGDRWVAASIGGKVDAYVDVPGEDRRIHKATLVAHKNNDPA